MKSQTGFAATVLTIALCFASVSTATEMTAERLLELNLEARGGAANWAKVTSMKLEGTYNAFSLDSPLTIVRQAPNLFRFDTVLFDTPVTMAYDGRAAWFQGAALGAATPSPIDGVWARNVKLDAPYGSLLQAYAAAGSKIDLLGQKKVEGETLWVLEVEVEDAPTETWYLDPETYLETKRVAKIYDIFSGPEFESDMEVFYMDYRDIGGVKIPFREERHYGTRYNVFQIEKAEANAQIDPGQFRRE